METAFRTKLRQKLDAYLNKVPPLGQEIHSGAIGSTATVEAFKFYTATEHKTLTDNWAGGGIRTTCNEFVGHAGAAMGSQIFLGQFPIESVVKKMGKGHAWIPANSGKRPAYGDVFRPVSYHMGISLDFIGNLWNTVESGQGGPISGFDILKRKQGPWNPVSLQGWVDVELLLDPRPAVPTWLVGWWVVFHGDKTYYYHFDQYHNVSYAPWRPDAGANPESTATETTSFSNDRDDQVKFTWADGSTESFTHDFDSFAEINEKMTGSATKPGGGSDALKGVRM